MPRRARSPIQDQVLKAGKGSLTNDQIARLLALVAHNPDESAVRKTAEAEGFPMAAVAKFMKLLTTTHVNFKAAVKRLGRRELIDALQDKIALALDRMTPAAFADMNAKDIAITLGILIEKVQLLDGRPTQIFTFEERRHVNELLPIALREAQRRGHTIDLTAVDVQEVPRPQVIDADYIQEERVSVTARKRELDLPIEEKEGS